MYVLIHDDVTAIFTDEDKAERVAELTGGSVSGPFEPDTFICEEPPTGKEYWDIAMNKDGGILISSYNSAIQEDGTRQNCWYQVAEYDNSWRLDAGLYANDREHAIALVNEFRQQILDDKRPRGQSTPYVDAS